MNRSYRTELEETHLQLREGLLRLWEQAARIEKLAKEGKSTESAKDVLVMMQKTLEELRTHIDFLTRTEH
jgi:hypothetical protein